MTAVKAALKVLLGAIKAAGKGAMKEFKETPASIIVKVVAAVGGAIASAWMYIKHIKRQHRDITDYDDSELSPVEMIQKRNMIYDRHVSGLSKKERKEDRFLHDVSKFRMDQEVASVLKKIRKGKSLTKEDRDILRDFEYYSKGDFHFDGDRLDLERDEEYYFNPRMGRRPQSRKNILTQVWEEDHGLRKMGSVFEPIDMEACEELQRRYARKKRSQRQRPNRRQLIQPLYGC